MEKKFTYAINLDEVDLVGPSIPNQDALEMNNICRTIYIEGSNEAERMEMAQYQSDCLNKAFDCQPGFFFYNNLYCLNRENDKDQTTVIWKHCNSEELFRTLHHPSALYKMFDPYTRDFNRQQYVGPDRWTFNIIESEESFASFVNGLVSEIDKWESKNGCTCPSSLEYPGLEEGRHTRFYRRFQTVIRLLDDGVEYLNNRDDQKDEDRLQKYNIYYGKKVFLDGHEEKLEPVVFPTVRQNSLFGTTRGKNLTKPNFKGDELL